MKDIAIFGVGGFGREVLTLIKDINHCSLEWNVIGFFDDGHPKGEIINGVPVLGGMDELNGWEKPLSVMIAIGNPSTKKKIVKKINEPMVETVEEKPRFFLKIHHGLLNIRVM